MATSPDLIPVLVTVKFTPEMLAAFGEISSRLDIMVHPVNQIEDVPEDVWARAEILYTSHLVPEPAMAPALRWIQVHSAGVDHIIDQPIVQQENIHVTSASGIHVTSMAEYTFAMMLYFSRKIPTLLAHQATAHWPTGDEYDTFGAIELRGSTVGIVGYGSVGREIARLANAFGMKVLASKRDVLHPADTNSYTLPGTGDPQGEFFERLYPPEAVTTMVRDCDFVVVTVPLTDATRNMVDADVIGAMKKTAYLINVGRGGVVDEDALLDALRSKAIAGAALDVFETEPLPADDPLWKLPNLIISPHLSGVSNTYAERAGDLFIENLRRYVAHKDLLNEVNLGHGY
ncbi:MAG TPA: D-2-hydroxyacid dehydrogenase [Aggregatilinea sp.]|uniref:D-2-hydroxyacid dehydrogenase n=1 Tax=Aggregatilinea sp. TaxID=2806333 RepID=UPI002B5D38E7|nr:D-2-hydroxyacid dehydrogenase [Aggregatilinea sp.]HML24222.1 D-2-hydroxyacid dehydrogenase [Aggregatilinea sp.]